MNKTIIKSFAIEARQKLISEITYKAGLVGINKDGISEPIHKASGIEMYDIGGNEPYTIKGAEISQRNSLASKVRDRGFENVIEEVAYTWFNRIIAIRFMEANDYLPTRVRVLSSENKDKTEPDIVTEAPNVDLEFTLNETDEIVQLKHDNKLDDLFRFLFIKQCNKLNDILPELFEKTADYTELLLSISFTNEDGIVRQLVKSIDEDDFREQVEIIGWLYQYYISEKKDEVINIYKGTVKKEDIPAATQLFTTDWVVRYMVDNSLGKLWLEHNPDSSLREKLEFYLVDTKDINEVRVNIDGVNGEKLEPKDIKFLDPCMGSGHILVYAFDVFMEIYKECGYSEREIPRYILKNNIFGVDIDDRAYQLAYFAVMMKARNYNRRILTEGIIPNLCSIIESNNLEKFEPTEFQIELEDIKVKTANYLIDTFKNAKQYGSILHLDNMDYDGLQDYIDKMGEEGAYDIFKMQWLNSINQLLPGLIKQAKILIQKYDVVATNPPYLNKMNAELKEYVNDNYKDYSGDLFSVFIYRNFDFCKLNGYSAFMTPFVWMFIKTYEKLREFIINSKNISSLIQMEYSAFEEATVPICTFVLRNSNIDSKGYYIKLSQFKGGMNIQKEKVLEATGKMNCEYLYITDAKNFTKIPSMPIAYWVSNRFFDIFDKQEKLSKHVTTRLGMATADNNRFVRYWQEVCFDNIGINIENREKAIESEKKWFPYNKGGEFRRWYGNMELVVNWENDGFEIQNFRDEKTGRVRSHNYNLDYIFKKGLTWSALSSSQISIRKVDNGFLFDDKGSSAFTNTELLTYVISYLNSKVASNFLSVINPTISFQPGNLSSLPLIIDQDKKPLIDELANKNILISKSDWDNFEVSWDFQKHPLILYGYSINSKITNIEIKEIYSRWVELTDNNFNQFKANEEELNRIFMEIYGLEGEFTPDVEEKNITIRKANLSRDIHSFISYAVGCMFGRYSLDKDRLIYAGGQWDDSKYKIYTPDTDNIIPITDDEYFTDDIVGKFIEFVKVTYGKDTLEENLDFIAKALGCKGDTSREIIRNYFIKDFYKDHVKTYQKKPIYWMFDSGKENGFKALIYMHRYNEDTVARVRTDYLHKVQRAIENAIESADIIIDSATSPTQKAKAVKQKEKLVKQLAETRNYDAAIGHVASKRIGIDLDDGVTVNYSKFQGVEVSREGKKVVKIDLLSKI